MVEAARKPAEHFQAIHFRHHNVENDGIELPRKRLFQALFAGVCRGDIVAKRLEVVLDQPAELLVVIYDKNGCSLRLVGIGDHDFILTPLFVALHFLNNRGPNFTEPLHGLNQPFTLSSSTRVCARRTKSS